jgi:hypothetical protein
VTERKGKANFGNRFKSTVMGTALFVAEMQRKVPLKTKIVAAVLIVIAAGLGTWAWMDYRAAERAATKLERAVGQPGDAGVQTARKVLASGDLKTEGTVRAIRFLGKQRDGISVPLLVDALKGPEEVTQAAAQALARIGRPQAEAARDALARTLEKAAPTEVVPVAWALASLGDERGLEVAIEGLASGSLQELPSYEPHRLAAVMDTEGLVERLGHPHATVRQFAARWLGEHCGEQATDPLVSATRDEDQAVVSAACVSVTRCAPERARKVVPSAVRGSPRLRSALTSAYAEKVGAPGLGILLASTDELDRRRELVEDMAALRDPRAGDELMQELERTPQDETAYRLEIAHALAEISDPRTPVVVEPLLDGKDTWAQKAIDVLGNSGLGADIESTLMDVADEYRSLRPRVARALGRAGACSEEVLDTMRRWMRRSATRTAAIEALGRCGSRRAAEYAFGRLERIGRARDGRVSPETAALRTAAYDAVARTGLTEASEFLLETVLDSEDARPLRTKAADALGLVGDAATRERAVDEALRRDTPPKVRSDLFRAVRHQVPDSVLPRLMGYVRGGQDNERTLGAARILGETARARLQQELVRLLDDERAQRIAALVVARAGNDQGARRLVELMATQERLDSFVREHVKDIPLLVSPRDFEDGSIYRRIEHFHRLQELGVGAFLTDLGQDLSKGADHPGGMSAREVRRRFERDLRKAGSRRRHLAAVGLRIMGARGVLLATRARGGAGAEAASEALR